MDGAGSRPHPRPVKHRADDWNGPAAGGDGAVEHKQQSLSHHQNGDGSSVLPTAARVSQWRPADVRRFLETIAKGDKWTKMGQFAEEREITGVELVANANSPDDLLDLFADMQPPPNRATLRTVLAVLHTYSVAPTTPQTGSAPQAGSAPSRQQQQGQQQQGQQQQGQQQQQQQAAATSQDDTDLFLQESFGLDADDAELLTDDDEGDEAAAGSAAPPAGGGGGGSGGSSSSNHFSSTEAALKTLDASRDVARVLHIMRQNTELVAVQTHGCCALSRLACADESQKDAVGDRGGIDDILSALKRHSGDVHVVEAACGALAAVVCDHARNQGALVSGGGIQVLLGVLMHAGDAAHAAVAEASCRALVQCTYDNADAQGATAAANGFRVVLGTVSRHAKRPRVVEAACHVLGNMLMDSRVNQVAALSAAAAGPNSNTCCPTLMCNLIGVLADHAANSRVVEIVCSTLVILLSADDVHGTRGVAKALVSAGGVDVLVQIVAAHPQRRKLVKPGCGRVVGSGGSGAQLIPTSGPDTSARSDGSAAAGGDGNDGDGASDAPCSKKRMARGSGGDGGGADGGCGDACVASSGGLANDDAAVVVAACNALAYLAKDRSTDPLVIRSGVVPALATALARHSRASDVVEAAVKTLGSLVFSRANADVVAAEGGLAAVRGVLHGPCTDEPAVVDAACGVLAALGRRGGLDALVAVLRKLDAPALVVRAACGALIKAGFDSEENSSAIAAAGGMAALLAVLGGPHTAQRSVIANACGALGVLVRRSNNCRQAVQSAGGVPALLSALQGHCARPWENSWLVQQACDLLLVCMAKNGGVTRLQGVLREFKSDLWVVAVVCGALGRLVDNGGASGLLDILMEHKKNIAVTNTCMEALRTMAAAHEPSAVVIRHNTALVYDVRRHHPIDKTVQDTAKRLLDQLQLPGAAGVGGLEERRKLKEEQEQAQQRGTGGVPK